MTNMKHPCAILLAEAHLEIFDFLRDDEPATIHLHPGTNGSCSYLFWKPTGSDDEVQIWEFDPQASTLKKAIRSMSIMGSAAKALSQFQLATQNQP
jgi:hypothetical protein